MPSEASKSSSRKKQQIIHLFKNDRLEEAQDELTRLLSRHPDDYELHYLAGMVHTECFRYVEALGSFQNAVRLNPDHGHSYFEMGLIHVKLCRFNKARPFFEKAQARKYNLAETLFYLGKIEEVARPSDVTLTTCLIVKNEEKCLPGCLQSVQAVSDEIVVVDTGSVDLSRRIAKESGAKVLNFSWSGDFAAARNFAIRQATGDWILQMDADEELFPEDQHKIREIIHQEKCNGAYLALHNRVSSSFGEGRPSIHYLVRLFKNREDFYYENPIHEVLRISGEVLAVDVNLLHHGYNFGGDHLVNKRKRNSEILYRQFEKDPTNPTTLFYLSMLHLGGAEYDLAESFAKKALQALQKKKQLKQHLYLMTLNNLALIATEKGDNDRVITYCRMAVDTNENYLDPYYFLGLAYFREGNYGKAKEIYEKYLEIYEKITNTPVFNLFANSASTYLFQVYHTLGKIYRREQDLQKAKQFLQQSLDLNPDFWVGLVDLGYLHMELREWREAATFLDRGIALAKSNPEVNEKNEILWFDFTNAVKNYIRVLKQVQKQPEDCVV